MPVYVTPTDTTNFDIFEYFRRKTPIPNPASFENRTFKAPLYATKEAFLSAPLSKKIPRYAAKPASMSAISSTPISQPISTPEPEPTSEVDKSILEKVWNWYTSSILPVGTKIPMLRPAGDIMPVRPPQVSEVTPENKSAFDIIASPATIGSVVGGALTGAPGIAGRIPQAVGYATGALQAAHGLEEIDKGETGSGLLNLALGALPFAGRTLSSPKPQPYARAGAGLGARYKSQFTPQEEELFRRLVTGQIKGPELPKVTPAKITPKIPAPTQFVGPSLIYESLPKGGNRSIPLAMPRDPVKYVPVGKVKAGGSKPPQIPPQIPTPNFEDEFLGWLRKKRVADIEAGLVRDKLPDSSLDDLIKNRPNAQPTLQHIMQLHRNAQQVIRPDYLKDTLYQLFQEDLQTVKQVFRHRPKGGYTPLRLLTDIQRGINAGLTPKFTSGPELAGWLEQRIGKAIANREFYDFLRANKLIKPTPQAPRDWIPLDPVRFPIIGDQVKGLTWSAAPEIADKINDVLTPDRSIWGKLGAFARYGSRTVLTGGVPWTGLNYHGAVNIPARALIAYGIRHPIEATKGVAAQFTYAALPKIAGKYLSNNAQDLKEYIRAGMTAGVEDFWSRYPKMETPPATFLAKVGKTALKGIDKLDNAFSEATFTRVIPATKLRYAKWQTEQLMKQGLSRPEAMKVAAHASNVFFGGIEDALQSRGFKQVKDIVLLAPDWFATKYHLGKNTLNAVKNPTTPEGQIYLNAAATALGAYLVTYTARKLLTGQEPPDISRVGGIPVKALNVPGKEAEYVPIGAAYDHIRLPLRILTELRDKKVPIGTLFNFLRSNTSPLMQTTIDLIEGQNPRGDVLRPKDKFGRPNPDFYTNVASELFSMVAQQPFQAGLDYYSGKISGPEFLSQTLELPFRWYRIRIPKLENEVQMPQLPKQRF